VVSAICEPAEGAELSTYDGEVRTLQTLKTAVINVSFGPDKTSACQGIFTTSRS
jgi:hypothetical protein